MTAIQKFMFETSFDDEAAADDQDEARNKPAFSEADLEAARAQAFAEGREAGAEETKQAIAQRADLALEVIAERLQTVERTHAEAQTLAQEAAARLALTIARKVLPELSRQNALTEIEGLVRECLTELQDEPRVVVRVHDAMLDPLRQRLDRVTSATGYTGKVVLLTSQTLDEIDCRVEWADGGAERNTEGLWQEIDRVIERTLKAGGMASVAAPEKQE